MRTKKHILVGSGVGATALLLAVVAGVAVSLPAQAANPTESSVSTPATAVNTDQESSDDNGTPDNDPETADDQGAGEPDQETADDNGIEDGTNDGETADDATPAPTN
ncbi:hypothetical protein [Cryobacterium sp. PAMC25264]|uniref:hypothetical protein n=1 Tax=Cryobacterium sp. PAMC25264 TaxID=2861288 RepID=UPI001C632142|nr:hypothetical protein [Cryobacterium sp. PAMC25264]QYF74376.1 hypothetical protein KY500_03985 [Cryobacterium sp. PAMC25264]